MRPVRVLLHFALLLFPLGLCADSLRADDVDYLRDIKPILEARCYACHGPLKQEQGLRLDTAAAIRIDSLTAQKRMVEAGFGLALLQASSVADELRAGTLHMLRVPALRVTLPVVLIHRQRAYLSGAVRALMALLVAWRGPGPDGAEAGRPRRRLRPGRPAG